MSDTRRLFLVTNNAPHSVALVAAPHRTLRTYLSADTQCIVFYAGSFVRSTVKCSHMFKFFIWYLALMFLKWDGNKTLLSIVSDAGLSVRQSIAQITDVVQKADKLFSRGKISTIDLLFILLLYLGLVELFWLVRFEIHWLPTLLF